MKRRIVICAGAILLIAGCAAAYADYTAVAAVAETRWIALALLASSALLLGFSYRVHGSRLALGAAVLAAAGVAFTIYLLAFAYTEHDVSFRSGDVTLRGTLYAPRWQRPEAGVVFIHGSGAATRDEFRWHAKHYARHGIAALAYDKRGAGRSGGSTWDSDYRQYAADVVAAVEALAGSTSLGADAVGLFGHSEGGWVAPVAASMIDGGPAFLIVSSTTPLTPAEQVLYETRASVHSTGFDQESVDRAATLQRRVLEYQRSERTDPDLAAALEAASSEPWFSASDLARELYPPRDYAWWRSVMDFDVRPYWRQVDAPVLAISGGLDRNSDVRVSQGTIRQLLRAGGNERFTGVIYPRAEHGMIEWWLPARIPPPRFPKGLPELLVRWVKAQVS